ncbi:MAG: type II secretion system protein [Deltaproteobacteria bacterium]|nr:type II secretion system protein [Deltaproteobacteria bacterium]
MRILRRTSRPAAAGKRGRGNLPPAGARGFTLLEVMISLAVLSIALVTVLHTLARDVDLTIESNDLTTASLLGQVRLAQVQAAGFPPLGQDKGDFGDGYPGYSWQTTVTSGGSLPGVRKVTVTVSWRQNQQPGEMTIEVYLTRRQGGSFQIPSDLPGGLKIPGVGDARM